MNFENSRNEHVSEASQPQEVTLSTIILFLIRGKTIIRNFVLGALAIGIVFVFLTEPSYQSQIVILPQQQKASGLAANLSSVGDLADFGAVASKSKNGMYIAVMQSATVGASLDKTFNLKERFQAKWPGQIDARLKKMTTFVDDKQSGFLIIKVLDESPVFAAALANGYVAALRQQLNQLAVTDAQQRRIFFETEIRKTLDKVSLAEVAFDQARKQTGLLSIDAQVAAAIQASSEIRAKISALDVQLATVKTFATDKNEQVQAIRAQIDALQTQLNHLETGTRPEGGGENKHSNADGPGFKNVRTYRELRYQQGLLDKLQVQLSSAQLDEAREGPMIQEIDPATPPQRPSSLPKPIKVLIFIIIGFIFSIIYLFIRILKNKYSDDICRISKSWQQST